jgi:hypothetical protein
MDDPVVGGYTRRAQVALRRAIGLAMDVAREITQHLAGAGDPGAVDRCRCT